MFNGTWLDMIPHYEFIMSTVNTNVWMSTLPATPCNHYCETVTGTRDALSINHTNAMVKP